MIEIVVGFTICIFLIVIGFIVVSHLYLKHLKYLEVLLKSKDPYEVSIYKQSLEPVKPIEEPKVSETPWVDITGGQSLVEIMNNGQETK